LSDIGIKQLKGSPNSSASIGTSASSQRAQIADAHYLDGLGQLGLNDRDKASQEFSLALAASPDHLAAKLALTGMMR